MITINTDGLCEPNPGGIGTWGWVAYQDGQEIATGKGCLGQGPGMTNNAAEYTAVIQALIWAYQHKHTGCQILTDSRLVVEQSTKRWGVKAAHLQQLCERVRAGLGQMQATIRWIPREENVRADALTQEAYREAQGPERHGSTSEAAHSRDWLPSGPYISALMAIDRGEKEVAEGFEQGFLADMLRKCPDEISPKQAKVVVRMAEKYLGPAQAAELQGQQTMFKEA